MMQSTSRPSAPALGVDEEVAQRAERRCTCPPGLEHTRDGSHEHHRRDAQRPRGEHGLDGLDQRAGDRVADRDADDAPVQADRERGQVRGRQTSAKRNSVARAIARQQDVHVDRLERLERCPTQARTWMTGTAASHCAPSTTRHEVGRDDHQAAQRRDRRSRADQAGDARPGGGDPLRLVLHARERRREARAAAGRRAGSPARASCCRRPRRRPAPRCRGSGRSGSGRRSAAGRRAAGGRACSALKPPRSRSARARERQARPPLRAPPARSDVVTRRSTSCWAMIAHAPRADARASVTAAAPPASAPNIGEQLDRA